MFYNTNGIPSDCPDKGKFWVQEFMGNFILKESDITPDIDIKCVELRYEVAKRIFGSTEAYYKHSQVAPIFFPYGGIDARCMGFRTGMFCAMTGRIKAGTASWY